MTTPSDKQPPESSISSPSVEPAKAIETLKRRVEIGQQLLQSTEFQFGNYEKWKSITFGVIKKIYGFDSHIFQDLMIWSERIPCISVVNHENFVMQRFLKEVYCVRFAEDIEYILSVLFKKIEHEEYMLEVDAELQGSRNVGVQPPAPPSHFQIEHQPIQMTNNKVFIVHGSNSGMRSEVARFIEKLGLEIIILGEEARGSLTVIELFEKTASEASFAVVILTGDDQGGLKGVPKAKLHPRARQNVIFELGYFVGKMGREKVCALYEANVEIPSDYSGVFFVELDPYKRWHLELARELKGAGFVIKDFV